MHSFMLFTNTALFAIILVQFLPSDNGLVNAIPTFNGADALLVRKKRQDDDAGADGDAEGGAEGEGDEKEGDGKEEGDEEGKGEGDEEGKGEGEGDEKEGDGKEEGDEEGKGEGDEEDKKDVDDKEEEKGDEEEGEGKKGGKGGGKKGGKGETPGNGNPAPGGGGGGGAGAGGSCIDNADGCERGFCTNVDWARAHCARTCASVLPECKQVASMPDPEKSCIDRADNCGSNADICQDENLAICGCPQKCGRCTQHQNFVAQGRCQSVFGKK